MRERYDRVERPSKGETALVLASEHAYASH